MSGALISVFANQRGFGSVPNPPTIGTATATGATTATVSYTAPLNNGGSTITSYTATSSPSGITGTLSQAGSGTITVTGLASNTSYTFTVTATSAIGTSLPSSASNSILTLYVTGQALGGGFFAGQISTAGNSIADYNLIVGPVASAQSGTNLKWKLVDTLTAGTSSVIDGPTNSSNMNNITHPAGEFCENLTIGGFSDWYLPAKNEMEVCYYNLKPDTTSNNTSSGINANAVPARTTNYANLGPPNITSAALFQSPAAEAFANSAAYYWNSTQLSASYAWRQYFDTGQQYAYFSKTGTARVRAIRRVAV